MLELIDLNYCYGRARAVSGINLRVDEGEIVALIGANGAGKTTTLRCISGILPASSGKILFCGEDISREPPHRIAGRGVGQVLEGRGVFGHLTVAENLLIGAYLRDDRSEIESDIERMFELFPRLKERSGQKAGTLSGGEQQMLVIARSLVAGPKLLLMDEPSLGLAPIFVESIFEVIARIAAEGTTILLVEQNAQLALEICNRGYVMELGRILMSESADKLLNNDMVKESYLGQG
ncbi:MAG TPA: ABC transporter ATP-binding protein [Sedimentisphaerales bacterium]|nr:ABC transporter ATP-binding protein [Sedimentisphaerales bacterium]